MGAIRGRGGAATLAGLLAFGTAACGAAQGHRPAVHGSPAADAGASVLARLVPVPAGAAALTVGGAEGGVWLDAHTYALSAGLFADSDLTSVADGLGYAGGAVRSWRTGDITRVVDVARFGSPDYAGGFLRALKDGLTILTIGDVAGVPGASSYTSTGSVGYSPEYLANRPPGSGPLLCVETATSGPYVVIVTAWSTSAPDLAATTALLKAQLAALA